MNLYLQLTAGRGGVSMVTPAGRKRNLQLGLEIQKNNGSAVLYLIIYAYIFSGLPGQRKVYIVLLKMPYVD